MILRNRNWRLLYTSDLRLMDMVGDRSGGDLNLEKTLCSIFSQFLTKLPMHVYNSSPLPSLSCWLCPWTRLKYSVYSESFRVNIECKYDCGFLRHISHYVGLDVILVCVPLMTQFAFLLYRTGVSLPSFFVNLSS